MTATTDPPAGGGPLEPSGGSAPAAAGGPDTSASLIGTSSSYLCSNCSAELAVDQHYCVECGARRGRPRFTLAASGGGDAAIVAVAPAGAGLAARAAGLPTRVIALLGVIAVLLALGIGVLIGESGNTVKVSTVTVAPAGSAAGTGASSGASGASTTSGTGSSAGQAGTSTTSSKTSSSSGTSSGSGASSGNFFGN